MITLKSTIVFLFLMMTTLITFAQLQDDFTDGDFTNNPSWNGDNGKFTISTNLLRLNDVAAGTAYLSPASAAIHNASWEFYIRMDFNTSSGNYAKVYLVSDQSDLSSTLNGYFLTIGGSTTDQIDLYKQTGSTPTKILSGISNSINFTTVKAKIKVTRDALGNWSLFTDVSSTGPTGTYTLEGTVNDVTHTSSAFFGVQCIYTITRATLFYFDDFNVTGASVPDMIPPTVISTQAINQNSVLVNFSEVLDATSAQSTLNYSINNNIGTPTSATLQTDNKSVLLNVSPSLTNGLTYSIQVSGVKDPDSNIMLPATSDFLYFIAQPVAKKDVIVSEFMADPSPPVGLPEVEFVEVFNRSTNPIDFQNWKLSDGTATATLPHFILMPASRLVITTTTGAAQFNASIGVTGFPSLNNAGDNIILKTPGNATVDSITYSTLWYHSDEKKDGGWSLEIVDPENICEEENNWTASENVNGGTPGTINSVNASNPDVTAPEILSAVIIGPKQVEINFNEKLDGHAMVMAQLNPTLIINSISYSSSLKKVILLTSDSFQPSVAYTLMLNNVSDCSGNALIQNEIQLILPEAASANDILINEILFNPRSGGVDFVELFNTTTKYISFKKWSLTNYVDNVTSNAKQIESGNIIIAPKSFMVFAAEPSTLKAQYARTIESVTYSTTLPSMPDDEGSIALVDSLGQAIDYFLYSNNYHTPFLKDKEGVSLERVSLTSPTNDANNWRSASQFENFATPGYKNSASADGTTINEGEVTIEPEIFSPQVAPTDFTKINYHFEQAGYVANVTILDQQGHTIKSLANNEVLGVEGFIRWDGDRDDGGRARAGYYIALMEVFNAAGKVNVFRKRVVVMYR